MLLLEFSAVVALNVSRIDVGFCAILCFLHSLRPSFGDDAPWRLRNVRQAGNSPDLSVPLFVVVSF